MINVHALGCLNKAKSKRSNVAAPLSVNQGEPMGRWEDVARLFGLDMERKEQ